MNSPQSLSEPHPDSPVLLTKAGAQAWKVRPLVEALVKIGKTAARPGGLSGSSPSDAYDLGTIIGLVIATLETVHEGERAAEVRAFFSAEQAASDAARKSDMELHAALAENYERNL